MTQNRKITRYRIRAYRWRKVGVHLQKTLVLLAGYGGEFAENARRHSRDALERADAVLHIEADRRRLRNATTGLAP